MDRSRRGWQQWTEQDARDALAELAASGESMAQFAFRRGVSTARIRYWRKRFADSSAPAFVAVPLTDHGPKQLEIELDGVTVRVREDLDLARLADLLDLVLHRRRTC